ncbi:MAG: ketopantoate reductase family protein [Acidobacteriaceae bacterium]
MKHGILGAGGVGGTIGAILAHYGEDVTFIVRPGTALQYPPDITLESTFATISAPALVRDALPHPVDILWITVKATQLEAALASIPDHPPFLAVVPFLNGVDHVHILRRKFGSIVFPATIAGEMERTAPSKYVHPSPFLRIHLASAGQRVLQPAADLFTRFGADCKFFDDEATLLWTKLVILAPFALSTTAAGSTIGGVQTNPDRWMLLQDCVREACAAAVADGAQVDADTAIKMLAASPPDMRSSMQKDVNAGRASELDAIAGPILRWARSSGRSAPATAKLVEEIRTRIQAGEEQSVS